MFTKRMTRQNFLKLKLSSIQLNLSKQLQLSRQLYKYITTSSILTNTTATNANVKNLNNDVKVASVAALVSAATIAVNNSHTITSIQSQSQQQQQQIQPHPDDRFIGLTGAQIIHELLREHGVEVVIGYPGGAILPVYDAIHESPNFRFILPRAEGGGGHMAEGYARVSGKCGVLLVTSGPGATNLVTPLADAMMDGTPLVALTGQVATSVIGSDAFQEADTVGITRPCTKWNTRMIFYNNFIIFFINYLVQI